MDDDEDDAMPPFLVRPPTSLGSRALEWIEVALQVFLKFLAAFVDFLDALLTSWEHPEEGASLFLRLFKTLWSQLPQLPHQLPSPAFLSASLWLYALLLVVLAFLLLSGFRSGFKLFRIVQVVEYQQPTSRAPPSKRLLLPDGRYIAYREHGVGPDKAKHSGLLVQGFPTSITAGIPGVNETLLEQFNIRLVAYDLAGVGQSDPNPNRTFNSTAQDMVYLADALGLGDRFWLLVQPGGGPHAWAAIRYIPERLSGVVLLAPVGNPNQEDVILEEEAVRAASREWSLGWRLLLSVARRSPMLARLLVDRNELEEKIKRINKGLYASVSQQEQILFEQKEFITFWERNLRDTAPKRTATAPLEELLRLISGGWSFRLGRFRLGWFFFGLKRLGFSFRLPSPLKGVLTWWWPTSSRVSEDEAASSAVGVRETNQTWQVFKFKLSLVGLVLVILLLVLR